jgi:competence protein ComEC
MGESSSALHPVALAAGPMLLGVAAAVTAPAAPWLSSLACRLADPFLVGLVAIARWAAGLPGASLTLSGPLRAAPAAALAVVLAAAALRHRHRTPTSSQTVLARR